MNLGRKLKKKIVTTKLIHMKNFKYIITLLFLMIISLQVDAQEHVFAGTWEFEDGNQIFRVNIWRAHDAYSGHFEIVEINNGFETILYTSDKPIIEGSSTHWYPVISGGGTDTKFTGRILDISILYDPEEYSIWEAQLEMKIINDNCNDCPIRASWDVHYYDLIPDNVAPFTIPTDAIMTKIE